MKYDWKNYLNLIIMLYLFCGMTLYKDPKLYDIAPPIL